MPILGSDIVLRKSAVVGDTSANGGRMTKTVVTDGGRNAMFPNFTIAERTAGKTRYRKFFFHVASSEDLPLLDALLSLSAPTPAGDRITIIAGTWNDTQADIPASPTRYGAASLTSAVASGATSITVTLEDSSQVIFREGGQVRIWDGDDSDSGEIFTASTVNKTGSSVTIGLSGALSRNFEAGSPVCSLMDCGDVVAVATLVGTSTSAGIFAASACATDAIGTIAQTITLSFTSSSAFSASSDVLGGLGTGNVSAPFRPINPDYARPYVTVQEAAWDGTWEAGDTVTITTTPAAVPFWAELICPAGASGDTNNSATFRLEGGTA